jgi:hypothetical protein
MENKISEKNSVLGLTVISMLLLTAMTIMPAMAAPQCDVGLGFSTYSIASAANSGNMFDLVISFVGYYAAIAFFAAAAAGGPVTMAACIAFL